MRNLKTLPDNLAVPCGRIFNIRERNCANIFKIIVNVVPELQRRILLPSNCSIRVKVRILIFLVVFKPAIVITTVALTHGRAEGIQLIASQPYKAAGVAGAFTQWEARSSRLLEVCNLDKVPEGRPLALVSEDKHRGKKVTHQESKSYPMLHCCVNIPRQEPLGKKANMNSIAIVLK